MTLDDFFVNSMSHPRIIELKKNNWKNRHGWLPAQVIVIRSPDYNRIEITKWCESNCQARFYVISLTAYFELENDAMLFKLTWG
jgi:hypothetical protein